MWFRATLGILWLATRSNSFVVVSSGSNSLAKRKNVVSASRQGVDEAVNGAVVLQNNNGDSKSLLASAFAALAENDQYDAVLTGLCAKILDETEDSKVLSTLQDPISLLQEMNDRKVAASGRSLMALVDASVKAQDVRAMQHILSLSLRNGGISRFGALQSTMTPLPSMPTSKVKCPDGSTKTRDERLKALAEVPVDDRAAEVTSALAASTVVGFCGVCDVLGIDDITPYTNLLLTAMVGVGVVDNFYDVLKFGLSLAKDKTKSNAFNLPEKGSMPFNLGTGEVTGTVVRGLTRLLNVDTERECQCEAAAFFAAYSLGLPCFAFRPNALEAAVLVVESMKPNQNDNTFSSKLDPLLSDVGIMKMLIWLMAPVAMETSKHAQLIVSDPREAGGMLTRLQDRVELFDSADLLWWTDDENERNNLLKWAYAEADLLLRTNKATLTELTERLAGGAATVGDCVAVMEDW